jgi:hypothetical protein
MLVLITYLFIFFNNFFQALLLNCSIPLCISNCISEFVIVTVCGASFLDRLGLRDRDLLSLDFLDFLVCVRLVDEYDCFEPSLILDRDAERLDELESPSYLRDRVGVCCLRRGDSSGSDVRFCRN